MRLFLILTFCLLLALVAGGFLLPRQVVVEREIVVQQSPGSVFTLLNGFRTFEQWSPMVVEAAGQTQIRSQAQTQTQIQTQIQTRAPTESSVDSSAANTTGPVSLSRSGPDFGPGARVDWSGDPKRLGTGWQEIVSAQPFSRIELSLHSGPQGDATLEYLITGDQLASRVRWQFSSDVSEGQGFFDGWLGRYFGIFLRQWVAEDLEQGLAAFKAYAESLPRADFREADIGIIDLPVIEVATVGVVSDDDPESVAMLMADAFMQITEWSLATGAELGDQPMVITQNTREGEYRYEAAIPLAAPPGLSVVNDNTVEIGLAPQGRAARIIHLGSYADTLSSYERLRAWLAAHGYRESGTSWVHYVSDPASVPAEALITHLYIQFIDEEETGESD